MTRQDTIHDEELCNAENMLNYFKYLHKNNKLEICKQYLSDLTRPTKYFDQSNLHNILKLAIDDQEHDLISNMTQLVTHLKWDMAIKYFIIRDPDSCSEGHERYLNLLGDDFPEE